MKTKRTVIVGGGASGLAAAIVLARNGIPVTILEQNSKIGKKILASGNGQCNIGNRNIAAKRFHSQNPDFVSAVLDGYDYDAIEAFFDSIGLPLIEKSEGRVYPMSLRASSVIKLLEYEAGRLGVEIVCSYTVESIQKKGEIFLLNSPGGTARCRNLILASGSPAAPQLGGSDSGYRFASSLGHSLIRSTPSLVQLCSDEKWPKDASGAKVSGSVKLYSNGKYITERRGDLLFTNYGISGLAILDISRDVSLYLAEYAYCELRLDLFPDMTKENLSRFLLGRICKEKQKPLPLWLAGLIHEKLAPVIISQSGCTVVGEDGLGRKEIGKLVYALKNLRLSISATRGFKGAEVAAGGVDTAEVESDMMKSRIVPGLYFAGEILDVDGDRGGFNFHFAWISAMRAAKSIISETAAPSESSGKPER